ncbi:MAG TPA: GDSL-type esterase/lipase family protein [Acidimicrobiales bacterium]|nr:GDSL-type esterase/lipase family protein [Acidimicrobiales bacterium]
MTTTLRPVSLAGGDLRFAGIVELEPTASGTVLHRMPGWARTRHNDVALSLLETMPSGGRIEMVTDATCLELDVQLTLVQLGAEPGPPATFELVVNGERVAANSTRTGTLIVIDRRTGAVDIQPGGSETIRFDGLPPSEKHVEVWLPHAAAVRMLELRADGAVTAPPPAARRWVHYGSSISHCLEATHPTGVWPVVAARLAGLDLQSFAFAGQCQLDPFAGRMIASQPADLVSLKLGINIVNADSMRERTFVPAVHGLLDTIRDRHPEIPIVLITPITCPVAEDHAGPTSVDEDGQCSVVERSPDLSLGALTLRRIRELEAEIVTARRGAGDEHLHLLPGPDLFGPDDVADLPDGLHPNAAGYQRMGDRFHAWAFEDGPFREVRAL